MLKRIYIDGFRHFKNFTLNFKAPHTLLCGLNGTGKTTVVEIISRLQVFILGISSINSLYCGDNIPRWEETSFGEFVATLNFMVTIEEDSFEYELSIKYNVKETICRVEQETLRLNAIILYTSKHGDALVRTNDLKDIEYPIDCNISGLQLASRQNNYIKQFLIYVQKNIFALSINPFTDFSESKENKDFLALDCNNFSAWYEELLNNNIASVVRSFDYIKPFIKGFKQFSHPLASFSNKTLFVDLQNKDTYQLLFNELSHGQKILCILYLVFHTCPENSVICIDEFENFLSPVELQPLYNLIQDIYEEKNVQCILVSHHQKTLNWFQDSAFILSYSSDSTFIRLKDFSEEKNISIGDYLFENQEQ